MAHLPSSGHPDLQLPALPANAGHGQPALVVFVDQTEAAWLRLLKPGFRHCFAALRQEAGLWLICDPLKHRIETAVVEPARELALAEAYLALGHQVCLGWTRPPTAVGRPPIPGVLTCVAIVKRLIGLRCPTVITPHQLHRHLVSHPEAPWVALRYRNLCLTSG